MSADNINQWGQLALSLTAIAGVVWGVVKFAVLRPLDRRIKEATRQIQPDANGGKSLTDVNKKVDDLTDYLHSMNKKISHIESRQLHIYDQLSKQRSPRRKKNSDK